VDPVVEIFFEEAAELLADFEAALLELEEAQGDAELL
jgi:chemotaxis protein histidine kinase CheA